MSPAPDIAQCLDCLAKREVVLPPSPSRCGSCGSPRVLAHPELVTLSIGHVDCDAFYAAVEKRDRPELRDRAVIIGGGRRGVVATACYSARIHGVHSAQPMWQALERCPDAVVVRPDMAKYAAVGAQVRNLMEALTPSVEPLSIDEAFLDLSGTERVHGEAPAHVLARFAKRVEAEIGITVSVGLSDCKFLAKLASDMNKPRGFTVIGRAEALDVLAPLPVDRVWGVGQVLATKLRADGLRTVGQLQRMDEATLAKRYGSMGLRLFRLSRGIDVRDVSPVRERKSVSAETTFNADLHRIEDLRPILRRLCEKVSAQVKRKGVAGHTVRLKLKTSGFKLLTRSRGLDAPTQLADRLFHVGSDLLAGETDGTRFRLIGIGLADLCDASRADPPDLVDARRERAAKAERAVDAIRARYGDGSVRSAATTDAAPQRDHPFG